MLQVLENVDGCKDAYECWKKNSGNRFFTHKYQLYHSENEQKSKIILIYVVKRR